MRTPIAPIFPLLLAALGSLLVSACGRNRDVQAGAAAAPEIPTVAVARAATANLSRDLCLTAEFKPYQEVDVMAKVSGYVKEIRVDVGDRVKEGELLATLEVPEMADDLRKSQAGVRHSQSEVARAQDEIARAKSARDIAGRFSSCDLILGARHFGLAVPHAGLGLSEVIGHFGDFQGGQELALLHAVAHIHADLLDVARDLGHHVDFLIRFELGGEDERSEEHTSE